MSISGAAPTYWRKCTSCKKLIGFGQKYWVCNVSTCNRKRTGLVFCDVSCWDAHVPVMNHRDAWAEERRAPSLKEWQEEQEAEARAAAAPKPAPHAESPRPAPKPAAPASAAPAKPVVIRRNASGEIMTTASVAGAPVNWTETDTDILIVASKLKAYISQKSGMNTSASVLEVLSDAVRRYSDRAIQKAIQNGRKTVLDRDFD